MQLLDGDAAQHLDVELALADRPLGGLAGQGERLRQQGAERVPLAGAEPQSVDLRAHLGVGQGFELGLKGVDALDLDRERGETSGGGRPGQPRHLVDPSCAEAACHGCFL